MCVCARARARVSVCVCVCVCVCGWVVVNVLFVNFCIYVHKYRLVASVLLASLGARLKIIVILRRDELNAQNSPRD